MKKKNQRRVLVGTAAAACLLGTAAVSAAYWTDSIAVKTRVRTMDIGIQYQEDGLKLGEEDPFMPGDRKELKFTVSNSGDISVDIKPEIRVTASGDMKQGGSAFRVLDGDGRELSGYSRVYYDAENREVNPAEGKAYRSVVYTLNQSEVLAGREQHESEQGETASSAAHNYYLELDAQTGNDFIGETAEIDVSTYAIQHRNRTDDTEEWIKIVVPKNG